jgi:hypothetical protein
VQQARERLAQGQRIKRFGGELFQAVNRGTLDIYANLLRVLLRNLIR